MNTPLRRTRLDFRIHFERGIHIGFGSAQIAAAPLSNAAPKKRGWLEGDRSPAYPMLFAAGAAWTETWLRSLPAQRQTRILRAAWINLGMGGLVQAALMLPFVPVNSPWWRVQDASSHQLNMEIGWPELAAIV